MIEGMVSRLAERLKAEPDDVEGWLRLIRSYVVLGRATKPPRPRAPRSPAFATVPRASASRR